MCCIFNHLEGKILWEKTLHLTFVLFRILFGIPHIEEKYFHCIKSLFY